MPLFAHPVLIFFINKFKKYYNRAEFKSCEHTINLSYKKSTVYEKMVFKKWPEGRSLIFKDV